MENSYSLLAFPLIGSNPSTSLHTLKPALNNKPSPTNKTFNIVDLNESLVISG